MALPYIVLRNDQQDELGAGLAATEYALGGKSADDISGLWQWVWGRLTVATADTPAELYGVAAPANAQAVLSVAS